MFGRNSNHSQVFTLDDLMCGSSYLVYVMHQETGERTESINFRTQRKGRSRLLSHSHTRIHTYRQTFESRKDARFAWGLHASSGIHEASILSFSFLQRLSILSKSSCRLSFILSFHFSLSLCVSHSKIPIPFPSLHISVLSLFSRLSFMPESAVEYNDGEL